MTAVKGSEQIEPPRLELRKFSEAVMEECVVNAGVIFAEEGETVPRPQKYLGWMVGVKVVQASPSLPLAACL